MTDTLGNTTTYNIDPNTGLTNSHKYNYYYDLAKRLTQYKYDNFTIRYGYQANNLKEQYYNINNLSKHIKYDYNKEDVISKITLDNNKIDYNYDTLGRLKDKTLNDTYKTEYEYITNGKKTSFILKSIKNGDNKYRYTYDKLGNITNIYLNEELINSYTYDNDNELITDIDYIRNIKTEYTYDNIGNILRKKEYSLVDNALINENTYEYNNTNWEDQLTKFNDEQITYDHIGNPLRVGDKELTWINGRQLQSYENDNLLVEYKYNKDGIRTSKRANGEQIIYYLENNNIIYEQRANNMIYYIRDGIGDLVGLEYNGSTYYYLKNAQNDIISILDSNHTPLANYTYDAYGNILSITDNLENDISNDITHIANINPFRYRSYYYDAETGLYYLNSRYYNPTWGRFINADNVLIQTSDDMFGLNLYTYCSNNPVNNFDPFGYAWYDFIKKTAQKVVSVVTKVATAIKNAFVAEIGVGFGVGGSVKVAEKVKVEAKANKTFNVGVNNGKGYTSTTTSAGISAGIDDSKYQFGLSAEINHFTDKTGLENILHNDPMAMPWTVWNCSNTKKSFLVGTDYKEYGKAEVSGGGIFIGISIDAYVILGMHLKIGFNIGGK